MIGVLPAAQTQRIPVKKSPMNSKPLVSSSVSWVSKHQMNIKDAKSRIEQIEQGNLLTTQSLKTKNSKVKEKDLLTTLRRNRDLSIENIADNSAEIEISS